MPGGYGRGNRYRWIYGQTGIPGWGRNRYQIYGSGQPPELMYPYPEPGMVPYRYPPMMQIDPEDELRMMEQELKMMELERDELSEEIESLKNEIEKRKKGGD
jgi:hypothetical protein